MYGRFSGPRGSWKGRGWDAEYKIMLHKNGLTVGKILAEKWTQKSWKIIQEYKIYGTRNYNLLYVGQENMITIICV